MDYKEKVIALLNSQELSNEQKEKLEDVFPELRENEDERTRKELITHCRNIRCVTEEGAEEIAKWIAWLEKQGEQPKQDNSDVNDYNNIDPHFGKPIDKVKPKFKHGDRIRNKKSGLEQTLGSCIEDVYDGAFPFRIKDQEDWELVEQPADKVEPKFKNWQWIVWQDKCYKVNYNGCGYELVDQNGLSTSLEYGTIDENAHLWTIQDAKDGDVLVSELCGTIMLYKGIRDNNIQFYCDYDFSDIDVPGNRFAINNGQHYGSVDDSDDWHPATKEQRGLLFQKMKEAGYEWDAEKKKLKKSLKEKIK